jgi:hypothetical protein
LLLSLPQVLSDVARQRSNAVASIKVGDRIAINAEQTSDAERARSEFVGTEYVGTEFVSTEFVATEFVASEYADPEYADPDYAEAERTANIAAASYMKEAALRAATFINLDAD